MGRDFSSLANIYYSIFYSNPDITEFSVKWPTGHGTNWMADLCETTTFRAFIDLFTKRSPMSKVARIDNVSPVESVKPIDNILSL